MHGSADDPTIRCSASSRAAQTVAAPTVSRRRVLAGGSAAVALMATRGAALAQDAIPTAPVKLVVGFAPGTSPDITARLVAKKVEETWKAGVVVENRPGAGGTIAISQVGTAAPDGQTFFWATSGEICIAPVLNRRLPFDPARLTPVTELYSSELSFVTGAQVPARTLQEFLKWSADKSPLLVGTFGPGTPHHLLSLMMAESTGRKVEPVHYKGVQDILGDLAGGNIHGAFVSTALGKTWQQTGKVRILGVSGAAPSPILPDVPTLREAGVNAEFTAWVGVFGPPGLPDALAARTAAAFTSALRQPDVKAKFDELGYRYAEGPRQGLEQRAKDDRARFGKLVETFKLHVE